MGAPLIAHAFLPPLTPFNVGVTALQIAGVVSMGMSEKVSPLAYSKFAGATGNIPSRLGMVILYALGLITSLATLVGACREPTCPRAVLVGTMLTAHYLKREFEVLWLHRYSGKMSLGTSCLISASYGVSALGIMHYTDRNVELGRAAIFGAALFGIGAAGNAWHHYLLATLRPADSRQYVIPQGGLFRFVACPHYFMELTAWLGMAISSNSLFGYLNFVSMAAYLAARSQSTTNWYLAKFGETYPKNRRNLIPGLF